MDLGARDLGPTSLDLGMGIRDPSLGASAKASSVGTGTWAWVLGSASIDSDASIGDPRTFFIGSGMGTGVRCSASMNPNLSAGDPSTALIDRGVSTEDSSVDVLSPASIHPRGPEAALKSKAQPRWTQA